MAELVLVKHKGALHPTTVECAESLAKIAEGQQVLVEVKAKRNLGQHRLAWKLASILHQNTDAFPSSEIAMDAIKIGVGHCETWIDPFDGTVHFKPNSIAFHKMENIDFMRFLDRAITLICARWMRGMDGTVLLAEINRALDYNRRPL